MLYFWKKLLRENRADAQDRMNPPIMPVSPAPAMMEGDTQGKEEEPKGQENADQDMKSAGKASTEASKERTAIEMCLEFLHKYNCDVEFSKNNENLCLVNFQGGYFYLNAWNDRVLEVTHPNFHIVPLDHYDEISRIRKAINRVNMHDFFTLYYVIDEEQQSFTVNAKRACFLPPEMKASDSYLYSMLTGCFDVARRFEATLDDIRREEQEQK